MRSLPFTLPSLNFSPLRYRPHGIGDWSGHIPFACDLIASLRPSVFVELGTHFGESYFAFCQAIAESGSETNAYAVDTWRGDVHTGAYGDDVFREVEAYDAEHFGGFSRLLRTFFDEAAGSFEAKSIDLLHIDGAHTYEAVRHDFDVWWPKVRSGGIVLFHDSCVPKPEFGVAQLMQELREAGLPVTEFSHSNGLGVVMKPGVIVEGGILPVLFSGDATVRDGIRRYYEICADHLEQKFWSDRRNRPAEWDVTSQLFWRGEGETYSERASVRAAHTVTAERSLVVLPVPELATAPVELRVLLSHSRAFLELHKLSAFDAENAALWSVEAANRADELRRGGLHCVEATDGSGVLVWDAPRNASFIAPISTSALAALQLGGQIVLEMSGVDPWSFATRAAGLTL